MVPFLPGTRLLGVALILFGLCAVAQADGFSAVVVYGDSLSDNGNLYAATGQPGAPYYDGRRSNGPVGRAARHFTRCALGGFCMGGSDYWNR
jgi:outer membrane lipase/esterase